MSYYTASSKAAALSNLDILSSFATLGVMNNLQQQASPPPVINSESVPVEE